MKPNIKTLFILLILFTLSSSIIIDQNLVAASNVITEVSTYTISGRVTDGNGKGISGVTILGQIDFWKVYLPMIVNSSDSVKNISTKEIPSSSLETILSATTDIDGYYSITDVPGRPVILSAEKEAILFNPNSRIVYPQNPTQQNFEILILQPEISSITNTISEETNQYLESISNDGSLFSFSQSTSELSSLEIGDIIVSDTTTNAPYGYLRKIISKNYMDGKVMIDTEPTVLEEAINNGTIYHNETLTPEMVSSTTFMSGVDFKETSTKGPTTFFISIEDLVISDKDGNLSTKNDQIRANGSIEFEVDYEFYFQIQDNVLSNLMLVKKYSLRDTIEIFSEIEIGSLDKEITLKTFYFPPTTFWIGPVPVVFIPKLDVILGLDGSVTTGISTSISHEVQHRTGEEYINSVGWIPISELNTSYNYELPHVTLDANIKGYIGPNFKYYLYGMAGPFLKETLYFEIEVTPLYTPYWKLFGGVEATVGFSAFDGISIPESAFPLKLNAYQMVVIDVKDLIAQGDIPNLPPDIPSSPLPENNSTNVDTNLTLSWNCVDPDGDQIVYDVFFEANDTSPDILISENQTASSYTTEPLASNTTYYWQINATDSYGWSTVGPVWSFTTNSDATELVSNSSEGIQGNDSSGVFWASVSGNGRFIAFASLASNLVPNDTNGVGDIFVHDRITKETSLISKSSDGIQGNYSSGNSIAISYDGRYIAFASFANNLVENDTNGLQDIFCHDMETGITELISISTEGTSANAATGDTNIDISDDGRFIVFNTSATNLVENDTNGYRDVFIRDRLSKETKMVSISSNGIQGNNSSSIGSISGNGRYVSFASSANNLLDGTIVQYSYGYIRDTQNDTTILSCRAFDGSLPNNLCGYGTLSYDGKYIAFLCDASNIVNNDNNGIRDFFVRDLINGENYLISVSSDGIQGDIAPIHWPIISGNGNYIVFTSKANNLVVGDTNSHYDVFLHNLLSRSTIRISVSTEGYQSNDDSGLGRPPTISHDGSVVAFDSYATNLVTNDINNKQDVFIRIRY